jgi:hypothetical protein
MRFTVVFKLSAVVVASCTLLPLAGVQGQQQPVSPLTPEHELLKQDVGAWITSMKIWPAPGAEPIESQALETSELMPGGLWLVTRFEGTIANVRCVGAGHWGYDPVEKRYVGTWVDSLTPHVMLIRGDYDPQTKTMTHTSEGRDPASGKKFTRKSTLRYLDDGSRFVETYATGPDGQSWKMMEVRYTRRNP